MARGEAATAGSPNLPQGRFQTENLPTSRKKLPVTFPMLVVLEPLAATGLRGPSSGAIDIPCHSMPLVHGLEVPCSPEQRHTGLGLTSLLELADDFRDHSAPSLASDDTTAPPPTTRHDGTYAHLPPDSCCESDLLFFLEMT